VDQALPPRPLPPPARHGDITRARVTAKGRAFDLAPNQIGQFDRVYVEPGAKVPVELSYPKGQPGDKIGLAMLDGGCFQDGKPARMEQLDAARKVAFQVEVNQEHGVYRVGVRHGRDLKILDLWVGEPNPIAKAF
jgi:hypothetical protein